MFHCTKLLGDKQKKTNSDVFAPRQPLKFQFNYDLVKIIYSYVCLIRRQMRHMPTNHLIFFRTAIIGQGQSIELTGQTKVD